MNYPSGKQGVLVDLKDPHLARQYPGDYLFELKRSVRDALRAAARERGFRASDVCAIGVDTTGSSPIPVAATNTPLALHKTWASHHATPCWLWKDHTSHREAAEITDLAAEIRLQFMAKCGNTYSSGWF